MKNVRSSLPTQGSFLYFFLFSPMETPTTDASPDSAHDSLPPSDALSRLQQSIETLRDFAESPVLPTGYAGMIVLALVPPLWRRVVDPRVRQWRSLQSARGFGYRPKS